MRRVHRDVLFRFLISLTVGQAAQRALEEKPLCSMQGRGMPSRLALSRVVANRAERLLISQGKTRAGRPQRARSAKRCIRDPEGGRVRLAAFLAIDLPLICLNPIGKPSAYDAMLLHGTTS